MTRQNYYACRRHRQRREIDAELVVQHVIAQRREQPRLGTRKLHVLLKAAFKAAGVELGRDRFFEVLRQRALLLEPQPAEYPSTTYSAHCLPVVTNRLKSLKVTGPDQAWVGDLTYL